MLMRLSRLPVFPHPRPSRGLPDAGPSICRAAFASISIGSISFTFQSLAARSERASSPFDKFKVTLMIESFKQANGDLSTERDLRGGQEWINPSFGAVRRDREGISRLRHAREGV